MYSAVQDKSANYTVVAGDAGDLIRVTTTSGAVTITLPTISTVSDGFKIAIVKWTGDANAVTVARSSTNTINGATSVTIGAQYSSTIFVADFETDQWFAASSGLGTSNVAVDAFSGNNSTVAFTLSADPGSENNTQVYVSGVYQEKDTYSVSGTTLTFSTAPPTGTSNIEVVSSSPLAIGTPSDGTVTTAKLASTTGSGAVVLGTSPTIATPTITGQATIPTINLTGGQITFPATASASSDANTLDDYEEGTWTPSIGGTATYYTQAGRYVKIGRIVLVNFQCEINVRGTGSTTIMTGLPFNPISAPTMAGCVGYFGNLAVNTYFLGFYANVNGQIQFIGQQGLDGTNEQPLAVFGNGTNIVGTLTYET
jgi:hypothetical protein